MTTVKKVKSFVKQFCAEIQGDSSKVTAERVLRGADAALNTQISIKNGNTVSLEIAVEEAQEKLSKARINFGKEMKSEEDRNDYITKLIMSRNSLVQAEEVLQDHKDLLAFLNEELKNLEKEEDLKEEK